MFFPIRCVFWLTIVFTTIFSQDQAERRTAPVTRISQAVQGVQGAIARALGQVETSVAEHCTSQPAECLGVAGKLSAIAKPDIVRPDAAKLEIVKKEIAIEPQAAGTAIPLPPPRPSSQASAAHFPAEKLSRADDGRFDVRFRISAPNG